MSGLPQRRMRQAIMIAWPGRIMIRPAEPRMRGSDPRTAVYSANVSKCERSGLAVCAGSPLTPGPLSDAADAVFDLG